MMNTEKGVLQSTKVRAWMIAMAAHLIALILEARGILNREQVHAFEITIWGGGGLSIAGKGLEDFARNLGLGGVLGVRSEPGRPQINIPPPSDK